MYKLFGYSSRADLGQALRSQFLWPNWRGKWILGRHACLGRDVFNLVDNNLPIFNIQKGRVDYFVSCNKQNNIRTRTADIARFLSRTDIIPFLRQQEYCEKTPRHPPSLVYMDSFSELADQLFIHRKDGWGGCCCYSDINHSDEFKELFEEKGLLDIEMLESNYRDFFNLIRTKYGEVPIVFLHFPRGLEARTKYQERGQAIFSIIENLVLEFNGLYSIAVDQNIVSRPIVFAPELKDFPYHYNEETYLSFAKKFEDILLRIARK